VRLLISSTTKISNHAEEYLETIYRLENKFGFARTMELSRKLNVVPGSITNTIKNLEKKGLVFHEPYKGVRLTESGRKIAKKILRRHRLAERLLTDFLNIDWSEVHDPACKLEHAISPEIIKPLEKALGHPKRCPHGNPIPTNCGGFLEEKTIPLVELETETNGVIVKIIDEESRTLQLLSKLKLTPKKIIKIEDNNPKKDFLTIKIENKKCTIDRNIAAMIHVKILEGNVKNK
jgi:DtxR family Mn-dependent transcriptional regulator